MAGTDLEFAGSARFAIERRLGAGGMGVVYQALDRERGARVALKTLKHLDAQALYRFKNEFRALADLRHPNLISLGELFCVEEKWFFTMDLVDGQDFLAYVRPEETVRAAGADDETVEVAPGGRPRYDEPRLRAALAQLTSGIAALHEAGKVHRDVKPSNVLVTRQGRVLLLDFGLITDLAGGRESVTGQIVGTPAYMAPEQASAERVGPAADWYAVGVVLYEALTGRLPFTGNFVEMILEKRLGPPPAPRSLAPDLDALCVELLRVDPAARPSGGEVLERLGTAAPRVLVTPAGASVGTTRRGPAFVGRARELAALREAFDASRRGAPVTVLVHGESGLGKSALVRRFVESLARDGPLATVLTGRCYERESVPYKALDGIVDALSRHLLGLDEVEAALLLPRDASLLAQLFPVLRRVPSIARVPVPRTEAASPQALRTRAFLALRELLARLCDRAPLVLVIDDFQWADADSLALLAELLRAPDAPPLLLLATSRLASALAPEGDARRIDLGALSEGEARELVGLLAEGRATDAAAIAREAGGHPLFIQELVRHASVEGGSAPALVRLDAAVWARVSLLEPPARALLEVVAVAGAPLPQQTIARAAGMDLATCAGRVAELRAASFVRTAGVHGADAIEAYHDRVREAVLAHLDEPTRRRHHARLADALEGGGAVGVDPNTLVRHLEAAGETARAARSAEEAAGRASEALAFERAAELYGVALRLGDLAPGRRRELRTRLASALASAERGPEAAEAYLQAAEGADAVAAFDCRRRAAEHLLGSGHLERGIEQINLVLAEFGDRVPATQARALLAHLWLRLRIRLRGLRWRPCVEREIPSAELVRIDVYQAIANSFTILDPIRGSYFQTRSLLLSLRSGEKRRIAFALGVEAMLVAVPGSRPQRRAAAILSEAQRIASECGDRAIDAQVTACAGCLYFFAGRLTSARACAESAERGFLTSGTADVSVWYLHSFRFARLWTIKYMGSYAELRRSREEILRQAARRGDRVAEVVVARTTSVVLLASDEPARARDDLRSQGWPLPLNGYQLPHFWVLLARGEADLYERKAGCLEANRGELDRCLRSAVSHSCNVRAEAYWLRGRLALLGAETGQATAPLVREAARMAKKLERERLPYASVWAALLRGGIAFQSGDRAAAERVVRDAISLAGCHDMLSCAAAGRRRLGEIAGRSEGAALVAEADGWYASEGVRSPERMTDMLAPGFSGR